MTLAIESAVPKPASVRVGLVSALAMLAAFVLWSRLLSAPDFPLDDAYITLHNARVLLDGHDANYGVSPLVGATSTVHLALVTALSLVFDLAWAGAIAAWLAAAAYMAGILFLAQRCRLSTVESALLVAIGFVAGLAMTHLLNGLETGLAMALVTWCIGLTLCGPTYWLPALLGLLPFVRPELGILSAVLFANQLNQRRIERNWRGAIIDTVILAGAALPWLAWMWAETGMLVPQTADAKRAFFAEAELPLPTRASAVAHAVGRVFLHVGPLAIALIGLRRERVGRLALLFCALMLALFLQQFPGGLSHNWNRYLYPLLPLFLAGLALLLRDASARGRRRLRALAVASVIYGIAVSPYTLGEYIKRINFARIELAGLTAWMANNIPPGARVAIHDAGYVAYATDYTLIDVVGLKTPESRVMHREITAPSAGRRRGEALVRILAESRADYLIVFDRWDNDLSLTQGIRAAGGVIEPLREEGAYHVYRVAARGRPAVAR